MFEIDQEEATLDEEIEQAIRQSLDMAEQELDEEQTPPNELFLFPVVRRPFFPGMAAPIVIEPGPYYEILKEVAKTPHKSVGLFLTKSSDTDIYQAKPSDLHRVGVLGRILKIVPMEKGGAQVILNMENRITLTKKTETDGILIGKVKHHHDETELTDELKAYSISIISTIKDLLKLNPLFKEELQIFLGHSDFTEPGRLADYAVALTTADRDEQQKILETFDIPKRINKALILLKKELDLGELQSDINTKIDAAINKNQREFFLREQLKTIKKELGIEKDDKEHDRDKYEERIKGKLIPKEALEVITEEIDKLSILDPHSAEYTVTRNYLDWLTVVPWGTHSKESHNLRKARKVLAEDHYGLDDIKQRILEFISVGKLTGSVKGSIICLVGPPGVGKTSVGKSIARALNREFYRFSVGGMHDEAEIKGHRRTYVGAMPGKMVQALKATQTMNPVIMLDEIDKIGNSYQGDPASALLEVLDPEQNSGFLDHYLDVRCDLSNVLFIVTANVLDTIPGPLRDRMEVLRLSGYIADEKVEIAKKYLIPRHRKEMGLKAKQVSFSTRALRALLEGYAREAGVRTLENLVKKILRRVTMEIVEGKKKTKLWKITPDNLEKYLDRAPHQSDRFYAKTPVGVCTGLAWTALGGATLYIETIRVPSGKPELKLTGQAGEVMKESSQIAWSYLRSTYQNYIVGKKFFDKQQVHMHIPEGATPKDGPSAGITMVTAMLSLLTGKPVLPDLGMTGELTLTGKVLPIGGIKEKVIAAKRSGLKTLIFPKENESDYKKLPENVRKGVKAYFVDHYDEVYAIAFAK